MELQDWDLHQELFDIIETNQIDPGHIRLEITESTTISNYDSILHNMQELNECGVSFFIGSEVEFYLLKLDENGNPIYENTYQYAILKKEWKV